jgi:two-component system C4-dicarboxylate transport response regulator DctD
LGVFHRRRSNDGLGLLPNGGQRIKNGTLAEQLVAFEHMLRRHNGNIAEASAELGMPKKTLYHKVRQLKFPAGEAPNEGLDG